MSETGFDALKVANDLEAAGMENGQAQAVAKAVQDARADLVTKADLDAGLATVRAEMDVRFAKLEGQMEAGFAQVDAQFAQVGAQFAQVGAGFGQVNAGFGQVKAGFARVDAQFAQVDSQFAQVDARFANLEALLAKQAESFYKWMWVMGGSIIGIMLSTTIIAFRIAVHLFA